MGTDLRIGTRSSRLARAQTALVVDRIKRLADITVEVVPVLTSGDSLPQEKRASQDGKRAFTKEIEDLLLDGKIDAAVHSMKDLPNEIDGRLTIASTPVRGDPRDVLVSPSGKGLSSLPRGAVIGTGSVRRKAQLLGQRSDLKVVDLRGNVESRIDKIQRLGMDGAVLAAAGLERLGRSRIASEVFDASFIVPAVCQGIIAVETRKDDGETNALVSRIEDGDARAAADCERAFSGRLGGDCNMPLGAYARVSGSELMVTGLVATPDGTRVLRESLTGGKDGATKLGMELAESLIRKGGLSILGVSP